MRAPHEQPLPGTRVAIGLTPVPGDVAEVRVIAVPRRDLVHRGRLSGPLEPLADAILVDVHVGGRLVIPGAWVQPEVLERGEPLPPRPVRAEDLRPPAVVVGEGAWAALHWGETIWPLGIDGSLAIPSAARSSPHPLSRLRRLALVAAGRRREVALTLWQAEDFEVPWHDVRLMPRARWWFEMAQVPPGMRYADAEQAQGVGRARSRPGRIAEG